MLVEALSGRFSLCCCFGTAAAAGFAVTLLSRCRDDEGGDEGIGRPAAETLCRFFLTGDRGDGDGDGDAFADDFDVRRAVRAVAGVEDDVEKEYRRFCFCCLDGAAAADDDGAAEQTLLPFEEREGRRNIGNRDKRPFWLLLLFSLPTLGPVVAFFLGEIAVVVATRMLVAAAVVLVGFFIVVAGVSGGDSGATTAVAGLQGADCRCCRCWRCCCCCCCSSFFS